MDTRKAAVAEAALAAGAVAVNDVSGGRHDPKLLEVTAAAGASLILGHLRGEPADMQDAVAFDDVTGHRKTQPRSLNRFIKPHAPLRQAAQRIIAQSLAIIFNRDTIVLRT